MIALAIAVGHYCATLTPYQDVQYAPSIMPVTAPITTDLIREANALTERLRFYYSEDSWEIRNLLAKADKLIKSEPAAGHAVKGTAYSLVGDHDRAVYYFDNALRLEADPVLYTNKASALSNLGYFSEGQEAYKRGAAPHSGNFSNSAHIGIACAAFRAMNSFLAEAQRLQLPVAEEVAALVTNAARVLSKENITDERLASYLDVAGELMRQHKVMFLDMPEVSIWDDDGVEVVQFEYRIPLSAAASEAADTALVAELVARHPNFPDCLAINFKSGLPANERYADRTAAVST